MVSPGCALEDKENVIKSINHVRESYKRIIIEDHKNMFDFYWDQINEKNFIRTKLILFQIL